MFKYDNLWNILEERNITKDELRYRINVSPSTLQKMSQNELVSLSVIDRLCDFLNCSPDDIMVYFPNNIHQRSIFDCDRCDTVNSLSRQISKHLRENYRSNTNLLISGDEIRVIELKEGVLDEI